MENQEFPWGSEQGRGSPRPFSSTFKKRPDQKGKFFDTREDFAVISPHYIFLESVSICSPPLLVSSRLRTHRDDFIRQQLI
jgi:hypothetical protein